MRNIYEFKYNNPAPGDWMKLYYMSDIQWTFLWFIWGLLFYFSIFTLFILRVCHIVYGWQWWHLLWFS